MEQLYFQFVSVVFGLIVGSFLSVCIYRMPKARGLGIDEEELEANPEKYEKISINYPPRSECTSCGKTLRWYHNIPVFSWLFLGGKCAYCGSRISVRYPLVEMISAFLCFMSIHIYSAENVLTAVLVFLFAASLVVVTFIDYDWHIIPDDITITGILAGFLFAIINWGYFALTDSYIVLYPFVNSAWDSLLGFLAGAGVLWVIREAYWRLRGIEGLGLGDVKLLAMVGACFGIEAAIYTIFVGSLLGSFLGILMIVLLGRKSTQEIPFGPYLALGTMLYLFYGPSLPEDVLRFTGLI